MIFDAFFKGDLIGIKLTIDAPPLTHLFFADDVVIFPRCEKPPEETQEEAK